MSHLDTLTLMVSVIKTPESCQMRDAVNTQVVNEFRDAMLAGEVFPPVDVVFNAETGEYILTDGFTRIAAAKLADVRTLNANVVAEGDEQVAQKLALRANTRNSQRRTLGDREKAIRIAIDHPDFKDSTEEEIAEATGTSRREVFRVRQKIGKVKNPDRHRDLEYEGAIKIIKEDNESLADNISVGIISMPREEVLRLAAKEDQERKALVPVMAERRLTLKQAEQLVKYIPNSEDLPIKTYIDFNERHPLHEDFYFRNHTVSVSIVRLP